jgi:hypothetical protein
MRETSNCSELLGGTMDVSRTLVPCRSSLIEQGQLEVAGTGAAGYFNSRWRPQLGALSRPGIR